MYEKGDVSLLSVNILERGFLGEGAVTRLLLVGGLLRALKTWMKAHLCRTAG